MSDLSTHSELVVSALLEDDKAELSKAVKTTDRNPTDGQKEAGNYTMGHCWLWGFDISVENAKGSIRRGKSGNGTEWKVTMPAHYGYIRGTVGKDKDHVDVYIGPDLDSDVVYVVDQVNDSRQFDEHKCLLGFDSKDKAEETYDAGFSDGKGPQRRGAVTAMSIGDFKEWIKSGKTKKPVALK